MDQQDLNITQESYDRIAEQIHSDQSPVGIDAKKTHIYIIHMLQQLEQRLASLETLVKEKN